MEIHSGHENKSWLERVGQAESVEKIMKKHENWQMKPNSKKNTSYATSSPVCYFSEFWGLCNFFNVF